MHLLIRHALITAAVFATTGCASATTTAQDSPAPEVPCDPFSVFFASGKSSLSAEARAVVAEGVDAVKSLQLSRVHLIGHTDSYEANSYDSNLSLRRAEAVKAEYVRLGVAGEVLTVEGKGSSDPMVPTGPNVSEQWNRFVMLDHCVSYDD
jgi:OmpA-OmpF porin, OOP family